MKETKTTEIRVRVKDGEQFYANESSINLNPVEINFDFKCVNQIQDMSNHSAVLIKHTIVIMQPHNAKAFSEMLTRAIKDYEKKFGKIDKPKNLKKAEKIANKEKENKKKRITKKKKITEVFFG
jgi:hypothetical protein